MGFYRRVDVRVWGDAKFCALSPIQPSAQALWLYLLTGPHTTGLPGLFRLGPGAISEQLGWPLEAAKACLAELELSGLTVSDTVTHLLFLPNAIRYSEPPNHKAFVGWEKFLDLLPESPLKDRAVLAWFLVLRKKPWFAKYCKRVFRLSLQQLTAMAAEHAKPADFEPMVSDTVSDTQCHSVSDTQWHSLSHSVSHSVSDTGIGIGIDLKKPPNPLEKGEEEGGGEKSREEKQTARRVMPSDRPELAPLAKKLLAHYQATVQPTYPPGGAQPEIIRLLADGVSEAVIRNAIAGFAHWCRTNDQAKDKRQSARTFFSDQGQFSAFADWQAPAPEPKHAPEKPARPAKVVSLKDRQRELDRLRAAEAAKDTRADAPGVAQGLRGGIETGEATPKTLESA